MRHVYLLFLVACCISDTAIGAPTTFQSVNAKYSPDTAPTGFKEFCAKKGNPNPNTCAVRLAHALFQVDKDYFKNVKAASGIEWYGLPTRASDLAIILNKRIGKAELVSDKNKLAGKKGIVFFDKIENFDGTGHISLWNGQRVVDGGDYFARSERVYFWPLP